MESLAEVDAALVAKFGGAAIPAAGFVARLQGGAQPSNAVQGAIEPIAPAELAPLGQAGEADHDVWRARGLEALGRGEVASVVLAGGMATRFGGAVKALVPAVGSATFLDLKRSDAARAAEATQGTVPLLAMTSFATDAGVRAALAAAPNPRVPTEAFLQCVSVRLTPSGEVFRGDDGAPSLYAPGHGDLPHALRAHGVLTRLRDRGVRLLAMSNVDNLVATLDPAVLGAHLASGAEVTVEVVRKVQGDAGGAPARVNGVPQVVEAFRFPASFDQSSIPVFNTNTFVFDLEALDREFPLTWFAVEKRVDGRPAVQFERLVGEVTAFLRTKFLEVPREGLHTRFAPAKDPDELARRRPDIEAALRARGLLTPA